MERKDEIVSGKTFLGIEFGSTRIKAVLTDADHTPIASGSHEWENRLDHGIWTYTMDDIWAGTENVAGIVGMAKALEIAVEEMQVVRPRIVRLRNYFVERVLREIPQGRLNGHPHKRLPGNVNFSFEGIDATSLLVLLEEDGICASAGSACNTGQTRISHVIEAIHVPKNYAPGSVRFTMGRETDRRQVDAVIASLKKNIGLLRGE